MEGRRPVDQGRWRGAHEDKVEDVGAVAEEIRGVVKVEVGEEAREEAVAVCAHCRQELVGMQQTLEELQRVDDVRLHDADDLQHSPTGDHLGAAPLLGRCPRPGQEHTTHTCAGGGTAARPQLKQRVSTHTTHQPPGQNSPRLADACTVFTAVRLQDGRPRQYSRRDHHPVHAASISADRFGAVPCSAIQPICDRVCRQQLRQDAHVPRDITEQSTRAKAHSPRRQAGCPWFSRH